jgi:hypothetical protein
VREAQLAAVAQVTLEGTPLPAERHELIDYASSQDSPAEVLAALRRIPDRSYERIDDVGDAITPTQPTPSPPAAAPRPESGEPPGGEAYLDPGARPGAIRDQPAILEYEQQLVREPGAPGEGVPEKGSPAPKPGV